MEEETPLHRKRCNPAKYDPDTSWHVALVAALVAFVAMAGLRSSGVIFVGAVKEFSVSREKAAWSTSVHASAWNTAGIVVRLLQKKMSMVRIMLIGSVLTWAGLIASAFTTTIVGLSLTYGAIHGAGTGIIIVALATIVMAYFDRYRGIANGIRNAGETCSSIAFPYLLFHLQKTYDFQGMMLIFGAVTMHTTAFTIALKEPHWVVQLPNAKSVTSYSTTPSKGSLSRIPTTKNSCKIDSNTTETTAGLCETLLNPMFYVIAISSAIMHYSRNVFTATIVDYGQDKGASLAMATSIIVYSSAADFVGHLVLPLLSDKKYLRRSSLVMWCHMLLGLSMALLPHASSFALLLAGSLCVTLFTACVLTMKTVLMADYLGLEYISACYGATGLVTLPLDLTTPRVVGFFRDYQGMYDNFYSLLGGLNFFAGLLLLIVVFHEHFGRSAKL